MYFSIHLFIFLIILYYTYLNELLVRGLLFWFGWNQPQKPSNFILNKLDGIFLISKEVRLLLQELGSAAFFFTFNPMTIFSLILTLFFLSFSIEIMFFFNFNFFYFCVFVICFYLTFFIFLFRFYFFFSSDFRFLTLVFPFYFLTIWTPNFFMPCFLTFHFFLFFVHLLLLVSV